MKVEQILLFSPLKELWVEIEFTTGTRSIHVGALPPSPRTFGKMAGGDAEHFLMLKRSPRCVPQEEKSSSYYRSQLIKSTHPGTHWDVVERRLVNCKRGS